MPCLTFLLYEKKMKIQFYGQNCFEVSTKDASLVFDPNSKFSHDDLDFATDSGGFREGIQKIKNVKKTLSLPGEFEISGVLVRGFLSHPKNTVYKVFLEGFSLVHFGTLQQMPSDEFLKQIGENDVLFFSLHDKFGPKSAKEVIEKLDPRFAFIGGDEKLFPKMGELGAKVSAENPFSFTDKEFHEEKMDILILSV